MGDFNWLTQDFVAFASPQHQPIDVVPTSSSRYASFPKTIEEVHRHKELPTPFKNVLAHFTERNVGLVVRLNSELYSPTYFTALGIEHLDMIFDDGTCPPLTLVRRWIKLAHDMITVKKRGIAVHCKAGLGRTGCLIGSYLIYRHGFTANEVIAFMRFMRPGMVVGPQQHWLHLNQGQFREWWYEDTMKEKLAAMYPSTPSKSLHRQRLVSNGQTLTPPNGSQKRPALGEIENGCSTTSVNDHKQDENLPAPTPGQPRKYSKSYGHKSRHHGTENAPVSQPDTEIVSMSQSRIVAGESESEEEIQLRMLARRSATRSPASAKRRAVSMQTTTTTTKTSWSIPNGESDIENHGGEKQVGAKTPVGKRILSGKGDISVSKARGSPTRRSTETASTKNGVRKTSGRIGSLGNAASAARVR